MSNSTNGGTSNLETCLTKDTLGYSPTEIERFTEQTLTCTRLTFTEFLAIDIDKTVLNVLRGHEYLLVSIVHGFVYVRRFLESFTVGEVHTFLLLTSSKKRFTIDFSLAVDIDIRLLLTSTNSKESFSYRFTDAEHSSDNLFLDSEESLYSDNCSAS